ncbi:MAG TPA: hypothetical protein VJ777_32455 [Mycobacterium sp.]|nr:hypothetical protein [Mycobacterium sp.]
MSALVPQLQAVAMQIECLRAQVDALMAIALGQQPAAEMPVDPAETCPNCGASGDSQLDTSTLDGVKRRKCAQCQQERIL